MKKEFIDINIEIIEVKDEVISTSGGLVENFINGLENDDTFFES